MSTGWAVTAVGGARDKRAEQILIDRLRLVFSSRQSGVSGARMHTRWHGDVDLLDHSTITIDETDGRL